MHKTVSAEMGIDILDVNRQIARLNEQKLHKEGAKAIDFVGAIGSGKTLIIERIIEKLAPKGVRFAAIAGDVAGDDDYRRLASHDIPVVNLNTGKECHLDAHMVEHALEKLDMSSVDVLFIENVGNLVCPADFPLGSDKRVTVISVTEGDDMVRKHPVIFGMADVIVVNKVDLADAVEVDVNTIIEDAKKVNPNAPVILTNAKRGEGIDELVCALGL